MRRFSPVILNFTAFWLILTIVAFALGHWAAGLSSLAITVVGCVGLTYRGRNPAP